MKKNFIVEVHCVDCDNKVKELRPVGLDFFREKWIVFLLSFSDNKTFCESCKKNNLTVKIFDRTKKKYIKYSELKKGFDVKCGTIDEANFS